MAAPMKQEVSRFILKATLYMYILCEMMFPEGKSMKLKTFKLYSLIQNKIRQLHGDYGAIIATESLAPLAVKYLNEDTNIVLIRTKRSTVKMVQSSMALITKTYDMPITFNTLHVGGTIRSCKKFLIRHHKDKLTAMLGRCTNDTERNEVKGAIIDSCKKCKRSIDLMSQVFRERVAALSDD